jgi:hypothetical protein
MSASTCDILVGSGTSTTATTTIGTTGENLRALHLFSIAMAIHRSRQWAQPLPYRIKDVRSLLHTMDCGDTALKLSRRDTTTRFFLSAAARVLIWSKIDDSPV